MFLHSNINISLFVCQGILLSISMKRLLADYLAALP